MLNPNPKGRLTLHSQLPFWKDSGNDKFLVLKKLKGLTNTIMLKMEMEKKKNISPGEYGEKKLQ